MELFARENQDDPRKMLADLVKLYALFYGVGGKEAVKMIRSDAQELVIAAASKGKEVKS